MLLMLAILSFQEPKPLTFLSVKVKEPKDLSLYWPSAISSPRGDGKLLYAATRVRSFISVLYLAGDLIGAVGAEGEGPGEFPHGVLAIDYDGDRLDAWDQSRTRKNAVFLNGAYETTTQLDAHDSIHTHRQHFVANDERVIVGAFPRKRCSLMSTSPLSKRPR